MPEHFGAFCEYLGIQFLIHSHVTYGAPCHARGQSRSSLTCDGIPCHARGHSHSFSHPTLFTVSATDLRERFLPWTPYT